MMLFPKFLATYVVAAGCINHVSAGLPFMGSRKVHAPASIPAPLELKISGKRFSEQDLAEHKVSVVEYIERIQQVVQSIDVMPSCNKLAAQHLTHSCESFQDRRDGQQSSGDEYLQSYQNLFAIRVTNCEQMNANDALPYACQPLLQTNLQSNVPREVISRCLEALNTGHPNQWTTFNRVKLDGRMMCDAMRLEANKDDELYLLKVVLASLSDLNGAIGLQGEELLAATSKLKDLASHMREFHASMHRDNQEIKTQVKNFSVELQDTMLNATEGTRELLRRVEEANEVLLGFGTQLGSSIQLANSRTDESDAQWVAKLQTTFDVFEVALEKQKYAVQQVLDSFHAGVYDVTKSVEIANSQTSVLASKLDQVTLGLEIPIRQIASLTTGAQDLSEIQRLTFEASIKTLETMEEAQDLAASLFNIGELFWTWLRSALGKWCMFCAYSVVIFIAALSVLWNVFPPLLTLAIAGFFAVVFSATFAWVQSPATFVWSILAHHPKFFSPVIWSVLTSVGFGVFLGEGVKQIYRRLFRSKESGYELRLPENECEVLGGKC